MLVLEVEQLQEPLLILKVKITPLILLRSCSYGQNFCVCITAIFRGFKVRRSVVARI